MLTQIKLSDNQISRFREKGFLVVPSAFSDQASQTIRRWAEEITSLPEEVGKHWVYHEVSMVDGKSDLINRIENMTPFHSGFSSLANSFISSCGQLFGEEAVLFKDKINFKMPGGDGFKPHQDAQAGWEAYAKYFINVMVCIDQATIENGCLELAERPTQMAERKIIGREWTPLSNEEARLLDFRPYPTKPGDIIFFDSYAPHKSARNITDTQRRLYFSTYNRLSEGKHLETYYEDKRRNYPPDIERKPNRDYSYRV